MKIGVIMGGISSEYEVSIATGKEIIENLDNRKYEICPIELKSKQELMEKAKDIDFAILALHGKYGEDGTIQGTLETMGIPYTGSNLLSSAVSMDKDISKKLMRYEGVKTPDWLVVKSTEEINYKELDKLGYPLVIKPNSGGSSIGASIVYNKEQVINAVKQALILDSEVIIEEYIQGEEITCPILNGELLHVISIKSEADFFNYASKYDEKKSKETVVDLPKDIYEKVKLAAKKSYFALKCSVYARVDMIIKDNEPFVLEVNTLPGMTQNSLFPKSAKAKGLTFEELLDSIIDISLKRF